ncbi:putative speckle-type poz protein [Phaeoacremonium minimum UCRPA7]|uniref:Putative speckle-type poz protein n=1 Tax=Phaeoacremonium minimum (strain UCR-PA7) TaxID=1286976 RepID=R8BCA8_PHAM7|nr:putative speckle-type poz protein [Phaeoacremonium minimum UCRPA7]EON96936.1 putative speckle-type poz protein [Phaeoacremonium minimum UCRPA7]
MTAIEEHDMEELQGASYLFRKPQEIQVKVENDIFYIHKALLIKDSESFKELLSTPLNKSETQIIKIEGMKSKEFGVYLDFVYRGYTGMGLHRPHHAANYKYTEDMLRLLKCSARFENKKLLAIATTL